MGESFADGFRLVWSWWPFALGVAAALCVIVLLLAVGWLAGDHVFVSAWNRVAQWRDEPGESET